MYENQVIRSGNGQAVWYVVNGKKYHVKDPATLSALGFGFPDVISVPNAVADAIPVGSDITITNFQQILNAGKPYGQNLNVDITKINPSNTQGNTGWIYLGEDSWITNDIINKLPDFTDDQYNQILYAIGNKHIDAGFAGNKITPGLKMISGQVLNDYDMFQRMVKIAAYKYRLNNGDLPTLDEIENTKVVWIPQKDFWDNNRGVLIGIVGVAGAALAPFTFGTSLAASSLVGSSISKNASGTPVLNSTTYNAATGQQTTGVQPLINTGQPQGNQNGQQNSLSGITNIEWILIAVFLGLLILLFTQILK